MNGHVMRNKSSENNRIVSDIMYRACNPDGNTQKNKKQYEIRYRFVVILFIC